MSGIGGHSFKSFGDNDTHRRKRHGELVSLRKDKRRKLLDERRKTATEDEDMEEESDQTTVLNGDIICQIDTDIQTNDNAIKLRGLQLAHKLMIQEPVFAIQLSTSIDMMGKCVQLLRLTDYPDIQFEAVSIITKIAAAIPYSVLQSAAIPPLVDALESSHPQLVRASCLALGNIIHHGPWARYELFQNGFVPSLINVLPRHHNNKEVMRQLSATLSNVLLKEYIPPQRVSRVVSQCLPVLMQMTSMDDSEILSSTCQAFFNLCEGYCHQIQKVADAGVMNRLAELLTVEDPSVVLPCVRTIGNIVSSSEFQLLPSFTTELVPKLMHLLQSQNSEILEEVSWILSNIATSGLDHTSTIMKSGILPLVFNVVENGCPDVQHEALWIIKNLINDGSKCQIKTLCDLGVIPLLCRCLSVTSMRVVLDALETIESLLQSADPVLPLDRFLCMIEECGALDKIEQLSLCKNNLVCNKANRIIVYYFDKNSSSEDNINSVEEFIHDIQAPVGGFVV